MIKCKNKNRGEFYEMLIKQIAKLIHEEIGNYLRSNNLLYCIENIGNSLDIYICDKNDCDDDILPNKLYSIGHYHKEDLPLTIANFDQEKKYMMLRIDEWIEINKMQNKVDREAKEHG